MENNSTPASIEEATTETSLSNEPMNEVIESAPAVIINDFEEFNLSPETTRSVDKMKYTTATSIQKAVIPFLLEKSRMKFFGTVQLTVTCIL